jgi:hypothetical protein
MKLRIGCVVVGFLLLVLSLSAQTASSGSTSSQVPPLIPFSSVASDEGGSSVSGVVNLTFSLYTTQQGGAPLWTETQNNIPLDATGHYSVQLGITKPNGVPTTLFTTGEARWLGVRIAEQVEQPRVLLLSVPYALKAGDAATIGGLPPSAFVLAAPLNGAASASGVDPVTGQGGPPPSGAVTGTGKVNYLPLWDSTSDIISSVLFQKGSGSSAKIGINTATPASTLDVKGGGTIRGTLSLPATGAATATVPKNSQPLNLAASAFNSTSSTAVNQTFQWQSEPVGNDTSTPSGTLNLLFGEGATKPSETGLNIASNGQITFATGQTFPGAGDGTVTSVATGLGLKGGPITSSGTLTIDTTIVPQLGATNTFTGNQTVTGTLSANGTALGVQATTTSVNGVGVNALSSATSGTGAGVVGASNSPTGFGVEGQNNATTGNAVGVYGISQSAAGYGVQGASSYIGVSGTGSIGVDGYTTSSNGSGVQGFSQSATGPAAGVYGITNSSAGYGLEGLNQAQTGTAPGVYGQSLSSAGYGVQGYSPNVGVFGQGLLGVQGGSLSAGGTGINGAAVAATGNGVGVIGSSNSPTGYGVEGIDGAASGGTAGWFVVNTGSATILQGTNGGVTEFKVDAAGDVTAAGTVSGSGFQIGGQLFDYGNYARFNAFLGFAGSLNTNAMALGDTAVGASALLQDVGESNTAVGFYSLQDNTTGQSNTGLGAGAGYVNDLTHMTGSFNTALGSGSLFSTGTLTNATAVGANALVSESNALVLGYNANVGIGTSTPGHLLDVAGFVAFDSTGQNNGNGIDLTFGIDAGEGVSSSRTAGPNQYGLDLYTDYNRRISIEQHGNVGIGTTSPDSLLTVNGSADKPGGGSWGTFSDSRLKTVNGGFTPGLSQVMKIHPVHYRYKADNAMGIRDTDEHIGVVAQDVQKVIPEAVTENSKGYLLVNNDPIIWTMLNAIKEQQGEFRQQQTELVKALLQIKQQQNLLRAQNAAMRGLQAEVRETRESLRKVKAQIVAAQPSLIAAK